MYARFLLPLIVVSSFSCPTEDCQVETEVEDNDFHITDGGLQLRPGALPFAVMVDETVEDETLLPEAVEWWNDAVGTEVLVIDDVAPQIVVSTGYVPTPDSDLTGDGDPIGIAYIDYAEDGTVLNGEVVLSSDVAYHRPTMLKALEHEFGHLPMALSDDPGIDVTVDLKSIMGSPLDPLGELTDHDLKLIEPYLP